MRKGLVRTLAIVGLGALMLGRKFGLELLQQLAEAGEGRIAPVLGTPHGHGGTALSLWRRQGGLREPLSCDLRERSLGGEDRENGGAADAGGVGNRGRMEVDDGGDGRLDG